VTLVVRDTIGQSASLAHDVTVTSATVPTVHLASTSGSAAPRKSGWTANVTVAVQDDSGRVTQGAMVTGTWTTGAIGTCVTGQTGSCTFSLTVSRKATSVTWTVTAITAAGYTYDATANVGSPLTIGVP
jgi:uncharacterized lipoprotein YmbA